MATALAFRSPFPGQRLRCDFISSEKTFTLQLAFTSKPTPSGGGGFPYRYEEATWIAHLPS